MIQKPSYGTTKTQMRWAFALAWMTIETLILGALSGIQYAVELAPIVIPSMILLIAALSEGDLINRSRAVEPVRWRVTRVEPRSFADELEDAGMRFEAEAA